MKKAAGILLLVLLVAAFALPGSADMNKYSTVFMDTFDTVISLIGYAENQETFDARAAETHAMYLHLHKLFEPLVRITMCTVPGSGSKQPFTPDDICLAA